MHVTPAVNKQATALAVRPSLARTLAGAPPFARTRVGAGRALAGWLAVAVVGLAFGLEIREARAQTHPVPSPAASHEFAAGKSRFEAGEYEAAAARFSKAAALEPANSLYAQWLGRAYGLEAQDASLLYKPRLASLSREALEKAVALDPENVSARSDLAAYYQAAPGIMGGGLDKARAQVVEIRKRNPYMGQVRAGDLLQDDNHLPESERAYLAAAALDPRRPEAHERLGSLYQESGRYAQAFEQWDTMLRNDPDQPGALYGLGKTADASGERLPDGEAALRKFLRVYTFDADGPSLAHGRYHLGNLAARRGDRDTAGKEYTEALRLNPQLKEAAQARAALNR